MITLIRLPAIETLRFATTTVAPPLGLAYVAGALGHAGFKVEVVDAVAREPRTLTRYLRGYAIGQRLPDMVASIDPQTTLIGLSVLFTHEWPLAVRLVELLKARFPNVPVILGGEHVTSLPEFCLRTSQADIAVSGEGEETIVELVRAFDGRTMSDAVSTIAGITYRSGDSVITNPRRRRRQEVDDIPLPDWDRFDLEAYNRMRFVGGVQTGSMSVPILATRGCPYQCTYCSSANMWTPLWLPRKPEKVVDEIESYVRKYGAGNFPFQDLTAIISKPWILAFCNELDRRGLKIDWQLPTGTRSEVIDAEVARRLRDTGMISMAYAPESGSARTRNLVKKKITSPRLFASIAAADQAGLNVASFVVLGFPHDTRQHLLSNRRFVRALARRGVTDLAVGFYMALPGTQLFHSLFENGKIRLDREYFRHILFSQSLMPSVIYTPHISRWFLAAMKVRLFAAFYGTRLGLAIARRGRIGALAQVATSAMRKSHTTKLQSAFRNGILSSLRLVQSWLSPRWISRQDEDRMIAGWHDIYARIHGRKAETFGEDKFPTSYDDLASLNIAKRLRAQHRATIVDAPAQPLSVA